MKDISSYRKNESTDSLQDLIKQWDIQHNTLERYIFVFFLTHRLLRKLKIEPMSRKGTILTFWFNLLLILSPPLIITSLKKEWAISPVNIWLLIGFVFGLASLTYPLFKNAGHNLCSFGYTVADKIEMINQIRWDHHWFNIRWTSITGIATSVTLIIALMITQSNTASTTIATGTYFMIAVLGYQIGENIWCFILLCVEAYRISLMKHSLYRLRPANTVSLQRAIQGYNQEATIFSLFMTIFLAGLALLLPEQQYLTNPILLAYLIITYIVVGLTIFVPRLCIQRIVQASKMQEMQSIQNLLGPLYNRIQVLSTSEFEQLKHLDELHEIVQSSCESFLPFSMIGRVLGNFILPTLTFFLSVASEAYLPILLESIFR